MRQSRGPAPLPDANLEKYHLAVARVFDESRFVAHLATRVEAWRTRCGPWWRRRYGAWEPHVAWFLAFEPEVELAHADGWDEGSDAEVADLDKGVFTYRGRSLRVAWLVGQEAEDVLSELSW